MRGIAEGRQEVPAALIFRFRFGGNKKARHGCGQAYLDAT